VKSMTGFGRANAALPDGTDVTVLARGVNHRFLDLAIKLRDEYASLEPSLRRVVGETVARGHLDLLVRTTRPAGRTAAFDEQAAFRYVGLWTEAAARHGLPAELSARDLLTLPGVVRSEETGDVDEANAEALLAVVRAALRAFDETRAREGESLKAALEAILARMESGIAKLDAERTGLSERLAEVLRQRIAKLAAQVPLDEQRLAQEVALIADRSDISEEVDRFKAHLVEVRRLLTASGPIGKRLDHLSQELHREVNTSGAKVREIGATRVILDLKSDVEAFKEQVQNVE